jgi:hypothetical protein
MTMADELVKPPRWARGQPFEKGRSGNPAGRRRGSRNRATLDAAVLLEGESEALTRKAVGLGLAGDPVALRLCIERILPVCRERAVRLALPPIEGADDASAAANAVTSALARGALTPGRADRHRGRDPRPGDRYNQKERICCKSPADFRIERFL